LLEAGSPVQWEQPGEEPAEGILEIVAGWQRGGTALSV
jgi:hypothetical protein